MLKSETNISFKNKREVETEIMETLKQYSKEEDVISQTNFLHKTVVSLKETEGDIKVTFSKKFYIIYFSVIAFFLFLPKESAFIWSSSLGAFTIFSGVMFFSLDYKVKTILDGFR